MATLQPTAAHRNHQENEMNIDDNANRAGEQISSGELDGRRVDKLQCKINHSSADINNTAGTNKGTTPTDTAQRSGWSSSSTLANQPHRVH
jgi:hypothetical protein